MRRLTVILSLLVAFSLAACSATSQTATPAPKANSGKITGPNDAEAKSLTGAGSTFINPLFSKWVKAYGDLTQVKVNYQGIGSGGGIQGISGLTLDFGATDGAMTDDQLAAAKGGPILHIAATIGAVAIGYNVPEATDPIKLSPENLALIYLGPDASKFTGTDGQPLVPLLMWNDARLVKDNPELKDVAQAIRTVHRSDSSGTTDIFTSYLADANPNTWGKKASATGAGDGGPGFGNAVAWPNGGLGGKGSAGVAGYVTQSHYTIGYFELAYAAQNNIQTALVKNKAGNWITPSPESASAAAANAKLTDDLRVKFVNADGEKSYPISGFTWILVYAKQTDAAKGLAVVRLIWWAIHEGQQFSSGLQYAQLPAAVVRADELLLAKITVNGTAILPSDWVPAATAAP